MPDEKESGKTVYHRLDMSGDGGARAPRGGRKSAPVLKSPAHPSVSLARTLAPLLIGFALLVGLVTALGILSQRRMMSLGHLPFDRERGTTETLNRLYTLRLTLNRLDGEARARDRTGDTTSVRPPGDLRLRNARGEVEEALQRYDELQVARTEKGQALRAGIDRFVALTKDLAAYNQDGFVAYREIERQFGLLVEEVGGQRESFSDEWYATFEKAKREIGLLTTLAAATGLIVALAVIWEVLRRLRQLRGSLEEVRRERQFSRQMLEGMVSAIAAIDERNRLRSANPAFLEIFPEAQTDEVLADTVKDAEAARLLAAATAANASVRPNYHGRWRLGAAGSRERVYDVYSSPLEIDNEPGQILTLVDVSEAVEAERELRRGESLAAVGQATAQVAHEIKNPLGSIRLGVAMLREMTSGRDASNTIDLVERGIEHLSKITSDVTQFSRQRELELAEVDLHELLDESFQLVEDKLREKKTVIERRFNNDTVKGRWDGDQLRQVFLNLVGNALDASPPQTPVVVSTERAEGVLPRAMGGNGRTTELARIHVIDQGAGMDEAMRQRIFEPFFTTKRRGTGLGLAIAKRIIDQHGGRISVESTPGAGTRFTVELPLFPDSL